MELLHAIEPLRARLHARRRADHRIGLVPTMGNLHQGHLDLVERARAQCDAVVVSIFVNPLQFGPQEDYDSYPRTLTADCALLEPLRADWLFAPNVAEMYPQGQGAGVIRVGTPAIADILCGANRPGHFSGVTTVVSKLFNIVQPDRAYFGEKDYQQLAIIRALVRDLDFPITITGVPTRREADGLAMSSRNGRLSSDDRQRAPLLYRALCETADRLRAGDRNLDQLCAQARDTLTAAGFAVDYFTVLAADDLSPALPAQRNLVILVAAKIGSTRLIDNLVVNV